MSFRTHIFRAALAATLVSLASGFAQAQEGRATRELDQIEDRRRAQDYIRQQRTITNQQQQPVVVTPAPQTEVPPSQQGQQGKAERSVDRPKPVPQVRQAQPRPSVQQQVIPTN